MDRESSGACIIHSVLCTHNIRHAQGSVEKGALAYLMIKDVSNERVSMRQIAEYIGDVSEAQIYRAVHALYS